MKLLMVMIGALALMLYAMVCAGCAAPQRIQIKQGALQRVGE
jgi:hypothetical protein